MKQDLFGEIIHLANTEKKEKIVLKKTETKDMQKKTKTKPMPRLWQEEYIPSHKNVQ